MKSICIIRHAKSSWGNLTQPDYDRPLNERGHRDAPIMAARLKAKGFIPDLLVSSPALRAKTTCLHFCESLEMDAGKIIFVPSLYHAPEPVFYEVIAGIPDKYNSALLFSHNPGITHFVNSLLPGKISIDNMPTCGMFAVSFSSEHWSDIKNVAREFLFFDYPKAGS
jgi:phosphohistidine phosphatase